jgi:hypothetical protein
LEVNGFPAFDVFTIETLSPCLASHVHPEPKFATAWFEKSSRNLSTVPHCFSMAALSYPDGSVLSGVMQYQ